MIRPLYRLMVIGALIAASGCGDDGSHSSSQPITCSGKTGPAGDQMVALSSGGLARTSRLHVPQSYDPNRPTMLVLNFHGSSSNGVQEEFYTRTDVQSDRDGFLIGYPEGSQPGSQNGWNGGSCCGLAAENDVDDVGFVSDLIDAIAADYCVDPKRIYATGMSNGGFISQRLGCELADRIAAIAPVAGTFALPPEDCHPSRPVPVLEIHGTLDPLVPYNGEPGISSVADTIAVWRDRDGCGPSSQITFAQGDATCEAWSCREHSDVELCTINEGGHTWPSAILDVPSLGKTSHDLNASERIAAFFATHPMS